jgi:hypothetical protein
MSINTLRLVIIQRDLVRARNDFAWAKEINDKHLQYSSRQIIESCHEKFHKLGE